MARKEDVVTGSPAGLERILIPWILDTALFKPEYPGSHQVLEQRELLTDLIQEFIGYAKKRCQEELIVMGYSSALALETANNVILKTVTFVALFLARVDVNTWIPEGSNRLSKDEQTEVRQKKFEQIYSRTVMANLAYFVDEYYDRPIQEHKTEAMGGYENTAIALLVKPVILDIENKINSPTVSKEPELLPDLFKQKILTFVDIYVDEFPYSWDRLQNNESYIDRLREEGLLTLYPLASYLDTLSTQYRTTNSKITEDGRMVMQDLTITLADVWNYELLSQFVQRLLAAGNNDQLIPLPSDFKHSLNLPIGYSVWTKVPVAEAMGICQTTSQGLEMVVNDAYMGQGESLMLREPAELLQYPEVIGYITGADTIVRLSDEVSDFLDDLASGNPNALAGTIHSQREFYNHCQEIDVAAGTNIRGIVDELFTTIDRQGNVHLKDDENHSYWVNRMLHELEAAKNKMLGILANAVITQTKDNDVEIFIRTYLLGAQIAVLVGTPANDMIFAQAMKLMQSS